MKLRTTTPEALETTEESDDSAMKVMNQVQDSSGEKTFYCVSWLQMELTNLTETISSRHAVKFDDDDNQYLKKAD